MGPVAAATIAAKRHLPLARVLASSFQEYNPGIPFFVLLADEVDGFFDPAQEPYQLLHLRELGIPNLPRIQFHYRQQELTYAATPYLLAHLLDRGFRSACFIKQESLVLNDLSSILDRLPGHSITLTPHLLRPLLGRDRKERELNILQSGIYNVGFLAVTETEIARTFLGWWQERLYRHCRHDVPHGMHYEQRWLDLVPGFFEDCKILRDPSFNVGHWNLPERILHPSDAATTVSDQLCRFFRFSGFDPEQPSMVTRYSSRLSMAQLGPIVNLFARYLGLLEKAGYHEAKTWPYAYDYFDNGAPIPQLTRDLYWDLGDEVERFGNPFHTGSPESYFHWLKAAAEIPGATSGGLSRLWRAIYDRRSDVRSAFPEPDGADRENFRAWTRNSGATEYGIPPQFQQTG